MIKIIDNKTIFSELENLNKDVYLSFQKIDMTNIIPVNFKNFSPYEWLFNHIGFYPIWAIKIPKQELKNKTYISNKIGINSLRYRKYLFILDSNKYTQLVINRVRWDSIREDIEGKRKQQYNFQDLLKDVEKSSVYLLNIIKQDTILKVLVNS